MSFDKFVSPNLPIPPKSYEHNYFNQLIRLIGSFFKVIDSKAGITADKLTTNVLNLKVGTYTAVNGPNNNIVLPSTGPYKGSSFVRISGPTSGYTITGIETRGSPYSADKVDDGHVLILFNTTSSQMSLHDRSASSVQSNRIICGGSNINVGAESSAMLIYSILDNTDGAWILVAHK